MIVHLLYNETMLKLKKYFIGRPFSKSFCWLEEKFYVSKFPDNSSGFIFVEKFVPKLNRRTTLAYFQFAYENLSQFFSLPNGSLTVKTLQYQYHLFSESISRDDDKMNWCLQVLIWHKVWSSALQHSHFINMRHAECRMYCMLICILSLHKGFYLSPWNTWSKCTKVEIALPCLYQ